MNTAPIRGFPGYIVRDDGVVFSKRTGKQMKPETIKNGYKRLSLVADNGKRKHTLVHRLVAEAFAPNVESKPFVNHIDEDTSNNSSVNLEWVTFKENVNHGTCQERRAEKLMKRVRNVETGEVFDSIKAAAETLNVNGTHIGSVCGKRNRTSGGYHWEYI